MVAAIYVGRGTGNLMKYCFDVGNIREIYEPLFKLYPCTHTHTQYMEHISRKLSAYFLLLKRSFIQIVDYVEYVP